MKYVHWTVTRQLEINEDPEGAIFQPESEAEIEQFFKDWENITTDMEFFNTKMGAVFLVILRDLTAARVTAKDQYAKQVKAILAQRI